MSYIAEVTHNNAAEIVLMRATSHPEELAKQAQITLGSVDSKVSDIGSTQRVINSSLTSVDLHGLTTLELAFAVLLVASAIGLVLALGLTERRRSFAILLALGAKGKQLNAFIWSEGLIMLLGGSVIGSLLGLGIAQMLVKVLTGVFDPPPQYLSIPWGYLALLATAACLSTIIAVTIIKEIAKRPAIEEMRNL
jgi:putative ABC transport system permease protein